MAQNIPSRTKWTPPPARIEGDRLLKARAAEVRVRNAAVQTKAQEERTKEILGQELGNKVEKLEETVDRLIDNIPKIIPNGGGGGKRMIAKVLDRDYPGLGDLPANAALKANNLSDLTDPSAARTNLGLGTAAVLNANGVLQPANNLNDVGNKPQARTNLGLGTAAVLDSGTASGNLKTLNTDGAYSFATTLTTQNFMPVFGGSWKAAHVLSSSDAASFAGTRSTLALTRDVLGAGGNNPHGDYTLFLTAKNTDLTDSTLGELGVLRMATFANGRGDKDLLIGTVFKHQGDGTAGEGAALAYELGVRIFQNNDTADLLQHHQILGAFVPNPTSTWGPETVIGYYSEHYIGAGFAHYLGIDDQPATGVATMQYALAFFRQRDIATPYFRVTAGTGAIESIWTDAGATGGVWRRNKNSVSPAANDVLWNDYWTGKNDAAEDVNYARLYGSIAAATDGAEAGQLVFRTMVAGSETDQLLIRNGLVVGAATGSAQGVGSINLAAGLLVNGALVVNGRKTGWSVASGTATRTSFATGSVTLPQLAERVKALIDDLHNTAGHGLIGT